MDQKCWTRAFLVSDAPVLNYSVQPKEVKVTGYALEAETFTDCRSGDIFPATLSHAWSPSSRPA